MHVSRVFHPVGQGAFFTEMFYGEDECFTVVYDCGTNSKPGVQLKQQIHDAFVYEHHPIDLFFISHLDADHVNGISCLIDNGYLNEYTTIVLPFCDNYQIELYEIDKSRIVSSVFSVLRAHHFHKIFFVPVKEDADSEGRMVDVRELSEKLGEEVTIMGLNGTLIRDNLVLTYNGIWEYVPFTMNDEASKDFFRKIEESTIVTLQDIQDVYDNVLKYGIRHNEKLKELKRIYNEVGDRRKKDTLININSLVVLSQSIQSVKHNDIIMEYGCRSFPIYHLDCNGRVNGRVSESAACVYTGDLNLKDDSDFEHFERSIMRYAKKGIDLIQIPHHGSVTSYNIRLTHGNSISCFTNFDSNKKIFNRDLLMDFALAHKPLFLITEYYDSKFVQEITI